MGDGSTTRFRVAAVFPGDVTEAAQADEDKHLRRRLRERAEYVRRWCEKVIAETDSTRSLDELRLDLAGIAYPFSELLQYAGAVENLRTTRLGPGKVLTVERVYEPPRKGSRKGRGP